MRRIRRAVVGVVLLIPMVTFGAIAAAARASNGSHESTASNGAHESKRSPDSSPTEAGATSTASSDTTTGSSNVTASTEGRTHPPGNNGTVKIDGVPFDNAPNNEPHPGCTFQIDFYNYEQGDLWASYEMELWAPTGSGTLWEGETFVGEDPASGGTDWDGSATFTFSAAQAAALGGEPNPNQGYHVRLTVHVPAGSIGADVKHKMFWVNCGVQTTTTPPPGGTTVTPTPSGSGSASTSVSASASASASASGSVLGTTVTPGRSGKGTTTTASVQGLAFTGMDIVLPLLMMLALLLLGAGALRFARRLDRTG